MKENVSGCFFSDHNVYSFLSHQFNQNGKHLRHLFKSLYLRFLQQHYMWFSRFRIQADYNIRLSVPTIEMGESQETVV